MKNYLLVSIFLTVFLSGYAQIYDMTMNNSACAHGSSLPLSSAIGPLNLIPNGNFNVGGNCSSSGSPNPNYHASWDIYSSYWDANYSYPDKPIGIPSAVNRQPQWLYNMYWRNLTSLSSLYPIYNGHIYTPLYQKLSDGAVRRNYILIELNKTLVEGKEYTFEASFNTYNSTYLNLAPSDVNLQMDRIGFALVDSIPDHVAHSTLLLTPFYETPKDTIISLAQHTVQMSITGAGQRYLIIGNFHENDSITFNTTPANNSKAIYAFDLLKLYDPHCTEYGNVYLPNREVSGCLGSAIPINARHGVTPYKWILNGVELPDTTSAINIIMPNDTSTLVVQSGEGSCISRDSLKLIPRYFTNDLVSDTMLYCNWNVNFTPSFTSKGGAYHIESYKWYEQSNPSNILAHNVNFTVSDSGTFVLEIMHSSFSCTQYDTVHVNYNEEIPMDLLPANIGPENCINMSDGYIKYYTSAYPTGIHFYWTSDLVSSDSPILDSLSAGTYNHYIFDDLNRCSFISSAVPIEYDSCSVIKGRIFNDENMNCNFEANEQGISNITVYTVPLNNMSITDSLGNFEILVPPGTYTINQNLSNDFPLGEYCNLFILNVSTPGLILDSNFIADTIGNFPHNPALQSFTVSDIVLSSSYALSSFKVANMGDSLDNITVGIHIDHPVLSHDTQIAEFIGMNGDTALYLFPNMGAFTSTIKELAFPVNLNVNYIGDTVTIKTFCNGEFGDIDSTNNTLFQQRIVLAAYDPNIKLVTPLGEDVEHRTKVNEREFNYTIHFQNTGNYPATDVLITDTLSQHLDISTFQLMGASHNVSVSSYNKVVKFLFKNIYLPDSTSDEANSKGFVQFRIKSTPEAYVGDVIRNSANIYFDNNPPIITPDAINAYYKPVIIIDTIAFICEGDTVNFNGNTFAETTVYSDTIANYYVDTVYFADITLISDDFNVNVNIISETELQAATSGYNYQWYDCTTQQEIVGAINQNFQPAENGYYAVIVNYGNCQDTSSCYPISTLSVENITSGQIKVKPNPTSGKVYVSGYDGKIEINDVLGNNIPGEIEREVNFITIDLSNYANGVYLIRTGNTIHRIIKQ